MTRDWTQIACLALKVVQNGQHCQVYIHVYYGKIPSNDMHKISCGVFRFRNTSHTSTQNRESSGGASSTFGIKQRWVDRWVFIGSDGPRISQGVGPNSRWVCANLLFFPIFCQKLHEYKRILTKRGRLSLAPLGPTPDWSQLICVTAAGSFTVRPWGSP